MMVHHFCHLFGRKGSKVALGTVCVGFWLTISVLYFSVHNHEQQSSSDRVLKRETRERVRVDESKRQIQTIHYKTEKGEQASAIGQQIVPPDTADLYIFPPCKSDAEKLFFDPTILKNGETLRQFTGRKLVPYVSVYPSDNTATLDRRKRDGNTIISRKVVDKLRESVKATRFGSRFQSSNIVRLERLTMIGGLSFGGRLFLIDVGKPNDIDSTNHRQEPSDDGSSIYHSEYAIESGQGDGLCHPMDYAIDYARKVHVIVTVKNLGKWVMKLIEEFEQLQQESGDRNFQIILADFNSTDTDLVKRVYSSKIGRKVKILNMGDKYNKGMGVKTAIDDFVQNPEDIIFLCDLHLEIPTTFLNDIRKHVIQNKMVFASVVGKLDKESSPNHPHGVWDINGFGVIAITREDWDLIGGMNTGDFKGDQWGGEDWDMIDRIVASGLIVNRRRVPGLLHHYHDKKDMWTGGRYHLVGGGAPGPGPGPGGRRAEMEYRTPAPQRETADERMRRDDVLRMEGIEELHFGAGPRGRGKYNMSL